VLQIQHPKRNLGVFMTADQFQLAIGKIIVRAKPAHTVLVTVSDAYNKPLTGADVYAMVSYGKNYAPFKVGRTGSKGRLQVSTVYQAGQYAFTAVLPGYYSFGTASLPKVGSSNWIDSVEIAMDRVNAVRRGRVVDEKGKPVAGASVYLEFGPRALTNNNGEFTLENMPNSLVRILAKKGNLYGSNVERNRIRSLDRGPIVLTKLR